MKCFSMIFNLLIIYTRILFNKFFCKLRNKPIGNTTNHRNPHILIYSFITYVRSWFNICFTKIPWVKMFNALPFNNWMMVYPDYRNINAIDKFLTNIKNVQDKYSIRTKLLNFI